MTCYKPLRTALMPGAMDRVEFPPPTVRCGKCAGCRRERARQWTIRMVHERQLHDDTIAVTLTYKDQSLPPGGSLDHKHFVRFCEGLRNRGYRFRYFMCGEYGEKNHRPHYHAVLYGVDFPDRTLWMHSGKSKQYRSDTLSRLWPHGWALIGDATPAAIRYVAGYLNKKLTDDELPVNCHTGQLLVPYQQMSRRPAIAKRWIERNWREVYPADTVVIEGREMRPPAMYDRWMKDHQPEKWREIRAARFEKYQALPKESAKRFRQRCEAIQLKQQPFEARPMEQLQ